MELNLLKGNEKDDVLDLVRRWLANDRNGPWLLIVDNADETECFFDDHVGLAQPESKEKRGAVAGFVPKTGNGTVLFTSRNRKLAVRLVGKDQRAIKVDVMSEEEALKLLETKLTRISKEECQQRAELCEALDRFPLAISQAAAYINEMREPRPIPRYLELLEDLPEQEDDKHVLNGDAGELGRDEHASNSILKTWQISFNYLQRKEPSAAKLLSIMAFFHRQGIPEFVLKMAASFYPPSTHTQEDSNEQLTRQVENKQVSFPTRNTNEADRARAMAFDNDEKVLRAYCLISVDQDGKTFQMHRSVQFATKGWLKLQGNTSLEEWRCAFMKLLESHFGTDAIIQDLIKKNNLLLIHALEVERDIPSDLTDRKSWVDLMYKASDHLLIVGQYSAAERILCTIADVAETDLVPTNLYFLELFRNWGRALHGSGNLGAAKEKYQRVILAAQARLQDGAETDSENSLHISELLLNSTLGMATILASQGESERAEADCLELLKQSYPSRELIQIHHVLGCIKIKQGKYPLAREYFSRQLEELEKLKDSGPTICRCLVNLSITEYRLDNESKAAELHIEQARNMYVHLFGNDHTDTALCSRVLAQCEEAQGRYEEALRLYETALPVSLKWRGADHEETVNLKTQIKYLKHKMRAQTDRSESTKSKEPQQTQHLQHRPKQ